MSMLFLCSSFRFLSEISLSALYQKKGEKKQVEVFEHFKIGILFFLKRILLGTLLLQSLDLTGFILTKSKAPSLKPSITFSPLLHKEVCLGKMIA